jgi:flagellar biosynthesis protein FlhB
VRFSISATKFYGPPPLLGKIDSAIPKATAVVVNPTAYAGAIRYAMDAPALRACGERLVVLIR